MRVHLKGEVISGVFSDLLLKLGNGDYPSIDGFVQIPEKLCTIVTSVMDLIENIYPDVQDIADKPLQWLCERAILTPKNDQAAAINDILLKCFQSDEVTYESIDTATNVDEAVNYPVEFLNSINPPGLPYHKLTLRVGTPVMLLRNLRPPKL